MSRKSRVISRRLTPWVTAALILILIFTKIDLAAFKDALVTANLCLYLPLILIFIMVWLFGEAQNLYVCFHRFGHPLSYADAVSVRGLTYLLMIINYGLGVGGMAVYLNRRNAIPLKRTASLMLFYSFIETFALSIMALCGTLLAGQKSELLIHVRNLCLVFLIIGLLLLIIPRIISGWPRLARISKFELIKVFSEINWWDFSVITFWRGLYYFSFVIFFFFALKAFNLSIPFIILAAYIPIVFFAGNIPITPSGIGTIQAAMLLFFHDYADSSQIIAFSLTYSCSLILLRVTIGLFFLKHEGRYLKGYNTMP